MGSESPKWLVVTGGTKGIGKAVAETFMQEGFNIITCARSKPDLDALKSELEVRFPGRQIFCLPADLSTRADCADFIEFASDQTDCIDILVNNTGIFVPGGICTEDEGVLERTISTNLYSAYHVTRGFLPGMTRMRKGHIFTMCSTASIIPYINGGSYCISKYALLGMTKTLREEMMEYNVRVTAILAGATLTDSWAGTQLPAARFMPPEEISESILSCWKLSDRTVVEEILLRPMAGDI